MLVYAVRRLLMAIPVLLSATVFVFLLVDISGDPLLDLLLADPPTSPEVIEAERERLYQDRSIPERYWLWLTGLGQTNGDIGLLQGKWGPTVQSADSIGEQLPHKLLITLRLVGVAAIGSVLVGIVTGVVTAVRQYSKLDHSLTFIGFLALSLPVFWFAALVKQAGISINETFFGGATVLAFVGESSQDLRGMTGWEKFTDAAGHLVLPTFVLVLTGYAIISRFQRASVLEVLNSDYVRLARAKGVRHRQVMRRHALRTALIPVVTLSLITIVTLIDGAIVTETVFEWRGMGRYLLDSVQARDSFAVMAWLLVSGTLIVVANLFADLLYGVLDPRIRYE